MPKIRFDEEIAATYDDDSDERFDPGLLATTTEFLAELSPGEGRALELAIGTGRVAVPLAERGVPVSGIELSPTCSRGCGPSPAPAPSRRSRVT